MAEFDSRAGFSVPADHKTLLKREIVTRSQLSVRLLIDEF